MTQTKIYSKMNELLRKYGDIDVIVYVDQTGKAVGKYTLAHIPVKNTADYNEVVRILKDNPPRRIKI